MPSRFEAQVINKAETEGWKVLRRGWPDFLLVKKTKILAVEAKAENDRISDFQQDMLATLRENGVPTLVYNEEPDTHSFDFWLKFIGKSDQVAQPFTDFNGLGVA